MSFTNASGFAGLDRSPLARVGYAKKFVYRYFYTGLIPDITYSDYDTELTKCNQVVQFTRQPVVKWKPYQRNQDLIPQEVDLDAFTFELCEADYVAIKIDSTDERYLCDHFAEWESSVMLSVQQDKEVRLNKYVLGRIPFEVASINTGNAAGADSQAIGLGAPGTPIAVTSSNIVKLVTLLQLALVEARSWEDGKMVLIVSPRVYNLLENSPLSNALTMGNCVNCSSLITGKAPGTVAGFSVYQTVYQPGTIAQDIMLAGRRDATMFAEDIIESRIAASARGFWKEYQMLMVYGEKTIQPTGWAQAYVSVTL